MHTPKKTSRVQWALSLTACLAISVGCDVVDDSIQSDDADGRHTLLSHLADGKLASLDSKRLLKLRLPSRPSTGYTWVVEAVDDTVLKELDTDQEQPADALSEDSTHVHRFVPIRSGRTTLKLSYKRPWETDVPPVKSFTVDVDVKGLYDGPIPEPMAPAEDVAPMLSALTATSLPSSYNYCTTIGGCTPITNQDQCGGCWAFATTGVVEQLIKAKDGVARDLSEQFLISCNNQSYSCSKGGFEAFSYFINRVAKSQSAAGAVYEADFKFSGGDKSCPGSFTHHEKLASYTQLKNPSTDAIKNAILSHGPIWTGVYVNFGFQYYTGGVFTGSSWGQQNHAVVITGWDDSQGVWILRNSWGSGWGEKGYMRIKYGTGLVGSGEMNYYATYSGSGNNTCTKTTCAAKGKNCGTISDGCSGSLNCGTCASGQTCTNNVCLSGNSCTPTTCAAAGKNCGTIPDGCGGSLNCGGCASGQTCGGAGVDNVCGSAGTSSSCGAAYNWWNCLTYTTNSVVSSNGRNYKCQSPLCSVCVWYGDQCLPGSKSCPWGNWWTDQGACK